MSATATVSRLEQPHSPAFAGKAPGVGIAFALWLLLVFGLATAEVFVAPPGKPPLALLIAAIAPILAFLGAVSLSRPFRELVLAADLPLLTAMQAWRFAGFGFLALSAQGLLPAYFAWPAGLGDMAVAVAAPWMALALVRRPGFAAGRAFVTWNVLGILDLVVAVSLGALGPLLSGGAASAPTGLMARLPLALIPGYLVPAFIVLHLTALMRARTMSSSLARNAG